MAVVKHSMLSICVFISLIQFTTSFLGKSACQCGRWGSDLRMTIAVFGGTGVTGREFVYQALMGSEKVIVLARDPYKLIVPDRVTMSGNRLMTDPRLTVVKGDVKSQSDVDSLFGAADDITGVVVVLGGKTKDVGKTLLTDGTKNIIHAMKEKTSAKRIAVVTSIGAGDSADQAPLMFKILQNTVMKGVFEDKNNQEKLFTTAEGPGRDLDYCLVRPGGLGSGAPDGVINVIKGQAGQIQRADVAAFLLGAVKDPDFPYLKATPCVSSVSGTGWVKDKKEGFDDVSTA